MLTILTREIKNYIKRPLFWIGIIIVILGVYQSVGPYLSTHYLSPEEEIVNNLPDNSREGEIFEGYVPSTEQQKREVMEKTIQNTLISYYQMDKKEAASVIGEIKEMDVASASKYLEQKYHYNGADLDYRDAAYHKGTREEINSYLAEKGESFSDCLSRKFADFAGLYMGFFAAIMLFVLFMQDTRKHTYELLHTKPVSARKYVMGKAGGGFAVCIISLAILNLVFWVISSAAVKSSGFEIKFTDFLVASCLYILPNMLMIVCVYTLISLLFKNPIPAMPLLILYMLYSNMGSRNAEGIYRYYGRPFAIMVRFPGSFFEITPPPMVLMNQSFLILASLVILFISMLLWKRRRM